MTLVSIIIPAYNREDYIVEAIESALNQTYRRIEVIVVDDGSTDSTKYVAEQYADRICVLSQSNSGQGSARNHGLRKSSGEAILFLDSDDRLHADAVQIGLDALNTHPQVGIVFGSTRVISATGEVVRQRQQPVHTFGFVEVATGTVPTPSQCLFRRSILDQLGGFDESIRFSEDFDLYLRMMLITEGYCHGQFVADYRVHPGQETKKPASFLAGMLFHIDKSISLYSGGDCSRIRRHSKNHWRRFFGQFIPQEIIRSALAGNWSAVLFALKVYFINAPSTFYGTAYYWARQLWPFVSCKKYRKASLT